MDSSYPKLVPIEEKPKRPVRWAKFVASILGSLAAYVLYIGTQADVDWRGIVVLSIVVGIFAQFTILFKHRDASRMQAWRNRQAVWIWHNSDRQDFWLLLRPFDIDRLFLKNKARPTAPILPSHYTQLEHSFFEEMLEGAVDSVSRGKIALIGLGRLGSAMGAGLVELPNDGWQPSFSLAGRRASALIVIPGSAKGISWELEWVKREGLVNRCIFILPPGKGAQRDGLEKLKAMGFTFADPKGKGLVMRTTESGSVIASAKFKQASEVAITWGLRQVLKGCEKKTSVWNPYAA